MNLFKVTWINYGELDNTSTDFCSLTYDVSNHIIFYKTCNGIRHSLRCDFGSIFDKIHCIVGSEEFQSEKSYEDDCDGDWYKFEYTLNGELLNYEGYIYGLKLHKEVISLIESCAKNILDAEKKLLQHKYVDNDGSHFNAVEDWASDIIESRKKLEEDFLDFWVGINNIVQIPDGFVKCNKCSSIIHNKFYRNRKYWGRVWLSDDELGDYEVEYDSGECPVCGQLNNELPYSGIDFQPDSFENNQDNIFDSDDEDKLYSLDEVDFYLKNLSEDDRSKLKDCQFKLHRDYPDDDSGEVYYSFRIYRNNIIVGWIDMNSYALALYEDSKENFSSENIKNPFDDSKLRCKKCDKVFCTCNKFFTRKD